jgi:hypothetical protein
VASILLPQFVTATPQSQEDKKRYVQGVLWGIVSRCFAVGKGGTMDIADNISTEHKQARLNRF